MGERDLTSSEIRQPEDEAWGDTPPNVDQLPGTIQLDLPTGADEDRVIAEGREFLNDNPEISDEIDTGKQDVVAGKFGNRWVLIIGAGVATLAAVLLIRKNMTKGPKEIKLE